MLISVVWVVFGAANLIRAGMAVYIAPALDGYVLSLPLPLLGSVYGLWGVIFIAAAVVAWRRQTTTGAFGLAVAYQVVLWTLNLVSARSGYARSLWPRDIFLTLVFLTFIALLAGCKRPQRR